MRTTVAFICLVVLFLATSPAQAQFRADGQATKAPVQVYESTGLEGAFNKLFSDEHFRMGHSYEMSYSSLGGQSMSMGMYTNTMMWQFDDKLAARVDVSLMQPFGGELLGDNQSPQLFLRNAEVAYRPSENVQFHISVQQSPYGGFASPYGGYYGPRSGSSFNMQVGTQPHSMFWRDDLR